MRRPLILALLVATTLTPAHSAPSFTKIEGFATKTGFRGIVAWQASEPVAGFVEWGTTSGNLSNRALPVADAVNTAGVVIFDHAETGTIYYRVADRISGARSSVRSFAAKNAYESVSNGVATIDLLVALDAAALPDGVPVDQGLGDLAAGVNILAERIYDALDGYARIGNVLVTDTVLNNPGHVPARGLACTGAIAGPAGTPADFLVQTSVPFDSHTWRPWAIASRCTGIYLGRLGWLVVPWENDLDLGMTMAHELGHYAFNAPDMYNVATGDGCNVNAYDISLMDNSGGYANGRWWWTELDRPSGAKCPGVAADDSSWSLLRGRYTNVPSDNTPSSVVDTAARGNPDGGALRISILKNTPGAGTLRSYTPED